MANNERQKVLKDYAPARQVSPELDWLVHPTVAPEAGPDTISDQGGLSPEKVAYARARKRTVAAVLGLITGVGLVASGVIPLDSLARLGGEQKPDQPKIPEGKGAGLYKSESPYKITGDPRLPTDKSYTVVTRTKEKQKPDVSVSEAWKNVLSSPYTGEDCGEEIDLIVEKDPEGAKKTAKFLLDQMRTFSRIEEEFAIRMGLLAMNLDPAAHDKALTNIVFLDAVWAVQEKKESDYVLSSLSETPLDPEKISEELKKQRNFGPKISFGLSLIGPVEFARVLAARAGIISSLYEKVGPGVYEVTEVTELGFSFNGLPVRYLKVKIISGQKMPEGILWFVSATDMQTGSVFTSWRVAASVTG